jgi:hypothetical protein
MHAMLRTASRRIIPATFPNVQGNVANQLNFEPIARATFYRWHQAELARLQSGNMSMAPAAPPPGMAPSR